MAKQLSPAAIMALKEALSSAYWYKSGLRSFLELCLSNPSFLSGLNWNNYKIQIVSDLIDRLVKNPERHIGDLTRLCHEVYRINDFTHLLQLDGGAQKAERAKKAIQALKNLVEPHQELKKEQDDLKNRQEQAHMKLQANAAVRKKLEDIKTRYMSLVISNNTQARGYELEKIMFDLFELFDLDPKASFRNTGEQIDGAFSLEGTDYLFEAKWLQELVSASSLDAFSSKIRRKLENTLGIFLSISGFSQDGVSAHQSAGAVVILIDGSDLMAVLEERIDFTTLLLRKKRHAARTGNIYLPYHKMISKEAPEDN